MSSTDFEFDQMPGPSESTVDDATPERKRRGPRRVEPAAGNPSVGSTTGEGRDATPSDKPKKRGPKPRLRRESAAPAVAVGPEVAIVRQLMDLDSAQRAYVLAVLRELFA